MFKLILCLGQDTFTPEVVKLDKNEEGRWRYWNYTINTNSAETVKLVRYLDFYRYEPVPFREILIRVEEEDTKTFFGRDKTYTRYYFQCGYVQRTLHPRVVHLEE